jgi:hypothetical protein
MESSCGREQTRVGGPDVGLMFCYATAQLLLLVWLEARDFPKEQADAANLARALSSAPETGKYFLCPNRARRVRPFGLLLLVCEFCCFRPMMGQLILSALLVEVAQGAKATWLTG